MPFTAQEIADAGLIGLDFYLRNNPIDQIGVERPFLKKLMTMKKSFAGAKQYVVEQIRDKYQSNFQWFNGSRTVTYNKRKTVKQANFPWRSAHDGFALDEDRLAQNGIVVVEGKTKRSDAEVIQLTNLLEEQTEVLRLGFEEQFDQACLADGSVSTDAIEGLDHLIQDDPTVSSVVGGLNQSTETYWRNHAATGLTVTTATGNVLTSMEAAWRACVRNGGRPDFIMAGADFIDGLRDFMLNSYGRVNYGHLSDKGSELGTGSGSGTDTGLTFHGVPIVWNPVFADLDAAGPPAITWEKRCYFLNCKHLKLRPIEGHDMITRKPPRAYDKYEYYWGLTWRGAICTNRRNAHAFLSIA